MPKSVGLVQLHFLPGSRFTDLETPVNQCLVNIYESFTSPDAEYGYIFAGPHLDDPEKAVVLICYDRSDGESAVERGLAQPSPIYTPITAYLRSAPRVDVVDFARPLPTSYGHHRERVQELALLRIPEYEEESGHDDEDSDESDDEPSGRFHRCLLRDVSSSSSSSSSTFSSWVDVHDEIAANDDNDANETPADTNNNNNNNPESDNASSTTSNSSNAWVDPNCRCPRRFFNNHTTPCRHCAGEESESSEEELFSSSSSSSPWSPFALPLAQLTSFFETAQSDTLHRGPGAVLASHRMGSRTRSVARGAAVVLHAYSWADAGAMARFKDGGDGCERGKALGGDDGEGGGAQGEGGDDDLWQTGFVRAVEGLRAGGAEVEVVTVGLRGFSAVLGRLLDQGGGGSGGGD